MLTVNSLDSSTAKIYREETHLDAGSVGTVFQPSNLSSRLKLVLYRNVFTELEKFPRIIANSGAVFINSMASTSTPDIPTTWRSQDISVRVFGADSGLIGISDLRKQPSERVYEANYRTALKFVSQPDQSSSDDSTIISGGGSSKEAYLPWVMHALRGINPDATERIDELRLLETGWDGYGAPSPTLEATQVAASLLLAIHKLAKGAWDDPFIAPLPDGGLELEWEFESGNEVILIVSSEGSKIKYLLDETTPLGEIIESEGLVPQDLSLSELIRRVI